MTTYTIVVPATGIAGVPIAVQIERKAAMASVEGLISIPAAVAINVIASYASLSYLHVDRHTCRKNKTADFF